MYEEHEARAASEQERPLLGSNHRRALATVLRRIEYAAWRLEETLGREAPPPLVLTRPSHLLDVQQRTVLLQLAQRLRQEIARLAEVYHLEAMEENQRSTIMAEFGLLWCDLEDVRPRRLSDYGPLRRDAASALEPQVQYLIRLVNAINDVAAGKHHLL